MKICVLMKQVPDKDSPIKISTDNLSIKEDMLAFSTNESDNYALEEALQIKEEVGGEVVVCTLGNDSAQQVVKDALAKGADRAIFIKEDSGTDRDILSLGKLLKSALVDEQFDLLFSGLQSDDIGNSQLGLIMAEMLQMTHASMVMGTEIIDDKTIKVKRELESGWFQWAELDLPASVTIQLGLNKPRYASLRGIMAMKKKPLEHKSSSEIEVNGKASHVNTEKIFIPQKTKQTQYFDGSTDQIVEKLVDYFKNEIGVI